MITVSQTVNGIWMGVVLLLLGIVPGLYQQLANGVVRIGQELQHGFGVPAFSRIEFEQPRGFAVVGVVILLLTLIAYNVR